MGIPLGNTTTRTPSIKLRSIGDNITVAIVNQEQVPWNDYATGKQKVTDDGKPRTQDKVTALVIAGNAVITSETNGVKVDRPVAVDEVVSIFFAGHHRWDYIQAGKALEGGLEVGDVLRVTYERDEAGKGASPKKVWKIQLRRPKAEEQARTARCVQLHSGAAAEDAAAGPFDDGEDF